MEQTHDVQGESVKGVPQDWAKLIRKLRWIGMEDEARRLQMAVCSLPPEQRGQRGTVSAGPFSTD
jgi:hypothetical protein